MNKLAMMILLNFFLLAACQQGGSQQDSSEKYKNMVSALKLPSIDRSMELPNSLVEISGLSFDASANVLIGHDDELGILYFIDFEGKRIDSKLKIGDIGDYEGVELVDDKVYLINSQGDVIEHVIGELGIEDERSRKFKTGLNASNNVEGLCYQEGKLLIALKGIPELLKEQNFSGSRAVYTYSLVEDEINTEPLMLFSYDKLRSFFKGRISSQLEKRLKAFAPSGIAIHPETQDIFILSFKGSLMLICDGAGVIKEIYELDQQDHRQPEGICFDKENRLYIANEGRKSKPVIHRYVLGN